MNIKGGSKLLTLYGILVLFYDVTQWFNYASVHVLLILLSIIPKAHSRIYSSFGYPQLKIIRKYLKMEQ